MVPEQKAENGAGLARGQDVPALQALWQVCFGDRGDLFFTHRFRPEETPVWREEGAVVASLMLLPVCLNGQPGVYVYAVGTLPRARGRGLMRRLHEAGLALAQSRGARFACLIPAEPSLFGLYRQLGYREAFWETERRVRAVAGGAGFRDCGEEELLDRQEAWLHAHPACLRYPREDRRFLCRDWKADGGQVLTDGRDYALCRREGETVRVRETSGPAETVAARLAAQLGAATGTVRLPGTGIPRGMGKILDGSGFSTTFAGACQLPYGFE